MSRSSRTKVLTVFLIVLIAAVGGAYFKFGNSVTQSSQGIGTVKRDDLVQRVTIAGKVISRRSTLITPPYNGYIQKLYVQVGQKVTVNAPLITLTQSLNGRGEEAYPLRAPFAGTVVQVMKAEGEYVEQSKQDNAIAQLDDLSQLFVAGDVPEVDIPKIKTGQEVLIRVAPITTRTYKGVIREISLSSKIKTEYSRTGDRVDFPIRIEVLDPDTLIRPGMSSSVDIIAAKHEKVLTLAHEFIQKDAQGYFVRTANGARRKVEVGLQNEEAFEITSGVSEGDQVKMIDFTSL